MTVPQPIPARPTARVLALDAAGRVLLLCHVDKRRAWIAPGGAVEAGESLLATAVRELAEETGLVASAALEALAADRSWVDAVAVDRMVEAA